MSVRSKIRAALLLTGDFRKEAAEVAVPPGSSVSIKIDVADDGSDGAVQRQMQAAQEDLVSAQHDMARLLDRAGVPRSATAPLTQLPEADPAIMDSVLQRARMARDPADYLRLLSHDPQVNQLARSAALPAMLLSDALLGHSLGDSQQRETIIDALRNLSSPSSTEARPVSALPLYTDMKRRAYPIWYPR